MGLIWKIWTSCGKSFCRIGRIIIYVSAKTYSKNFFVISDCQKIRKMSWYTFWRLAKVFPADDGKLRLTCPVKHSEGKQGLEWKDCSKAISEPGRETVCHSGNLFYMVVKTALYISRSFWREWINFEVRDCLLFANFQMKIFTPPAKISVRSVKTAFFVFNGVLRNYVFWERAVCFSFFGHWAEKSGHPAERPSTILMNLYITGPEKNSTIFPS